MSVELVIDGAWGLWRDGRFEEHPAIEPRRIRELTRRLRLPATDPTAWESIEIETETSSVIEEHAPELEPGTDAHVAAVVRSMGGEALIV